MKFSVIIPLYNKAPYVAKAIGSVLSQTFSDYELVIVDDGSMDDSAEIAARVIDGYANCRLLKQENEGVSMARNNGVAVSHGGYLCFLDADDWWEPTFLAEMDHFIAEFPEAGIYGTNYTIVNETKRKTRVANIGVEEDFVKGYINYCQVYAKTLAMPLWTGAVCVPRKVFDEMQGFPKGVKLGEDFVLWIHIALKYQVAFLNKPLSYYNQDVDVANRGLGRLYRPQENMLWNLTDLEPLEHNDQSYKMLVDKLRTNGLMPYLVDKRYRCAARGELNKVCWDEQPRTITRLYKMPIGFLGILQFFILQGSNLRQKLRGIIHVI